VTERRPNILFLLSDEHSFRFLSYLTGEEGGEPVRTPVLDRLARGGAAFDNAYCATPLCTPSRYCLWTGRPSVRSGAARAGSRARRCRIGPA
jgi:choline-sulfatase